MELMKMYGGVFAAKSKIIILKLVAIVLGG